MTFIAFLDVETYFMPWLLEKVEGELNRSMISRTVLDGKKLFNYCFAQALYWALVQRTDQSNGWSSR